MSLLHFYHTEQGPLHQAAQENSAEFVNKYFTKGNTEGFLKDEEIWLNFSPCLLEQTNEIKLDYDIDGVVIQLQTFSAIKLHYISIKNPPVMLSVFHHLKKHVFIQRYNDQKLRLFKQAYGISIANPEVGMGVFFFIITWLQL